MTNLPDRFRAAGLNCGIKKNRTKPDLGLLLADSAVPAAAVFTRNRLLGAHVIVGREHLESSGGRVRAVLVNSGNANCSTGSEGIDDNRRVASALAELVGCRPEEVQFQSTGVIGARLPVDRILASLPELHRSCSPTGLDDFARAILTTDLVTKVSRSEGTVGVAKGSGMIHPDMATMLAYLVTDAELPADSSDLLRRVADRSFHRVTVDGDTSPNDAVLLLGTGGRRAPDLESELSDVSRDLARRIARDGEGATRLVTVVVRGGPDEESAARVARVIATSPLTKTAVHGRDPNWGRILAAAGRAGVEFDPDRARVWIGPGEVYRDGKPLPDNEEAAHLHMVQEPEVELGIDLGAGDAEAEAWTCDLSSDYVRINADYRT